MNDMIAWLNGVLDKREAIAQACATGGRWRYSGGDTVGAWTLYDEHWSIATMTVYDTEAYNYRERMSASRHPGYIDPDAIGAHAALNDPAQILADVAADRALLDLADQLDRSADCEAGPAATQLYRTLAAKYATWPGYRPEWGGIVIDADLFKLPQLTGQWLIANPGTRPPEMTVKDGIFGDPWPDGWTPVGAPDLTAVLEFDINTGHTLRFANPTQITDAVPVGKFALGCDDPTNRRRIVCPAATFDHLFAGFRLLSPPGHPLRLFTVGTLRTEDPPIVSQRFADIYKQHGLREGTHYRTAREAS